MTTCNSIGIPFDRAAILIGSQRASSAAVAHRSVDSFLKGATVKEIKPKCTHCGTTKPPLMIGSTSKYRTKSGEERVYIRYRCRPCNVQYGLIYRTRHRKQVNAYGKIRHARNPEKNRARGHVSYAVSIGSLVPQPCFKCDALPSDAHHEDYSRPFDLVWLCRPHHIELHRKR